MLFGEKYGDEVRMIEFGTSKELCGGTHAPATGSLGTFRILSESAVAAGIRRIEATTGAHALERSLDERTTLTALNHLLKSQQPVKAVEDLLEKVAALTRDVEQFQKQAAAGAKTDLLNAIETVNGINVLITELDLPTGDIKDLAFQLKAERAPFFGVFGSAADGKATLSVAISDDVVADKGLHAGQIVKQLAAAIRGGGGGQPFFATAGGKHPDGMADALKAARELI